MAKIPKEKPTKKVSRYEDDEDDPLPEQEVRPQRKGPVVTSGRQPVAEAKAKVVALRGDTSPAPSYVRGGKGRGLSRKSEDQIVPMLKVLQPLSPELNETHMKYVEGAEAGMIYLQGLEDELYESITFQHCRFEKHIVEWIPRGKGGGFVARHDTWPPGWVEGVADDGRRQVRMTKSGNQLIETRYHIGNVILKGGDVHPFIIPFSSTGHTVSRQWQTMMNAVRVGDGEIPDAWTKLYRLNTVRRTNAAGTWYLLNVQPIGWANEQQAKAGEMLFMSFEEGRKQFGEEGDSGTGTSPPERSDGKF
jgi:hypothetical protein